MINNIGLLEKKKSVRGNYWLFNRPDKIKVDKLKDTFQIPEIMAAILANRNIKESKIGFFLKPYLKKNLPDPYVLKNMKKTVNILVKKILNNESLGLLGDYDVDGATSSAIIYNYLKGIGKRADVFIPDRIKDGYGISINSINFFIERKISLVISLDCGSNDKEAINYAKKNGIDVIVIDHHEVKTFSDPLSIINPKLSDDNSGLENLCTAGLAFLLIVGLNRELRNKNLFDSIKEPNVKEFLDIVAIGTVCDLVPLQDINRLFVKKGLDILDYKINKGIDILKSKLNLNEKLTVGDLAYYIGPCINAAGRIGNSKLGFNLLINDDAEILSGIADQLIRNNNERKTLEKMCYKEAKGLMDNNTDDSNNNFILVVGKNWHPGIVGIIASKLVEEFNKPSFVISVKEEKCVGSVRSVKNIDISKILDSAQKDKIIDSGGGHAMAGGLRFKYNNIKKFRKYLKDNNFFFKNKNDNNITVDIVAEIPQINLKLIENLEQLQPYGIGNREPRFVIKNISATFFKIVGKDNFHISCVLEDVLGNKLNGIAFNSFYNNIGKALMEKKHIHALGKVSINEWLEKKSLQFNIEDIAEV